MAMNMYSSSNADLGAAIESSGNTFVLSGIDGHALIKRSGDEGYMFLRDKNDSRMLINADGKKVIGAERKDSINYVSIQDISTSDVTVWEASKKWKLKRKISEANSNSAEYLETQFLFSQAFEATVPSSSNSSEAQTTVFFAGEPEAGRLWGFWNNGQYNGAVPGSDAGIFDTYSNFYSANQGVANNANGTNIIAILDTGVNYNHEELNPQMWVNSREKIDGKDSDKNGYVDDLIGYDFANDESLPWDRDGHGTHVAATAAAAINKRGVLGANPAAKILGVKVLGPRGGSTSDIIEGYNYALLKGAKVINLSLGGPSYSKAFDKAINKGGTKFGAITVAAAGNEFVDIDKDPSYPAAYKSNKIISVAASDTLDNHANFSNWGKNSVDLYAPGTETFSAYAGSSSSYKYLQGTSMAAPMVAGIVSAYWSRNPNLKPDQVIKNIYNSTDYIGYGDYTVTGGRVNMEALFGFSANSSSASQSIDKSIDPITGQGLAMEADSLSEEEFPILETLISNKQALAGSRLTDNIILHLDGSQKERAANVDKILDGFSSARNRFEVIEEIVELESFDNEMVILDFKDDASRSNEHSLIKLFFAKNWIDSIELDSTYYAT